MALSDRSESPLSDIGSDAFSYSEGKSIRSRSPSEASVVSDASNPSATPSTSTPRNADGPPAKRRRTGVSTYDHATPQSSVALAPLRSPSGSISSDSSGSVPTSPSFAHLGPAHPLSSAYAAAQANPNDPESADYTQVTRCQWTNCAHPEQGNMDNLVAHLNDVHILPRQKKYFCEWEGCMRKSLPHTSAYALKAHMRSHTKEKPFMCSLPECDRNFTRSDALAKHMRAVHETESLRASDPTFRNGQVPANLSSNPFTYSAFSNPSNNSAGSSLMPNTNGFQGKRLKLSFKKSSISRKGLKIEGHVPALPTLSTATAEGLNVTVKPDRVSVKKSSSSKYRNGNGSGNHNDHNNDNDDKNKSDNKRNGGGGGGGGGGERDDDPDLRYAVDMDKIPFHLPVSSEYYPPDMWNDMDEYERNLPPSQYFRLLRRQVRWAEQEGETLKRELGEARVTTDDVYGNTVKTKSGGKNGSGGGEIDSGDLVRREEWFVVEGILDHILKAEVEQEMKKRAGEDEGMNANVDVKMDVDSNGGGDGDGDGNRVVHVNDANDANDADLRDSNPWQVVKAMERP